jgi:hypothetical protein
VIGLSTVEAEYMSLTQGAKETIWGRVYSLKLGGKILLPNLISKRHPGINLNWQPWSNSTFKQTRIPRQNQAYRYSTSVG